MPSPHSENQTFFRTVSEKAAFSKAARKKLIESKSKLDGVAVAVRQAVETGRLKPSTQLDRAIDAMEVNFRATELQLRILQKSGEDEWDEHRAELDSAWENLARSIKNLAARFADGTR
jgi:hypothetical protein